MDKKVDKSIDDGVDNLIPDDLEPPKNKIHTILTIIALFIIVLMSTIIMTKIILDDSKSDDDLLNDPNSIKDPALILDENKKDKARNEIIHNIKPETTTTYDLASYDEDSDTIADSSEDDATTIMNVDSSNKLEKKSVEKEKVIEKESKKPIKEESVSKTKKDVISKTTTHNAKYYIQVGSFAGEPSKRLLSVIKSTGFTYTLKDSGKYKRLLIGGYGDKETATRALSRVKDKINKSAIIIKLK
ncbi:membrane protein [hydrothermal vent metagenome]|uniref:Membrane protein n=1 Tax=hydrothermal vent metagenome TaxID=652676 RepID=A0A1W1EJM6_9ZZZZ